MDIYDIVMMPLESWILKRMRAEIMPSVYGDVLEVGIGTGINLRYYNAAKIRSITGLDRQCSPTLERRVGKKFAFYTGDVEKMPFAEGQFDTVVATLLFCTANIERGMCEIQRVLKPVGLFVFIEHVRPKGVRAGKFIDFANPAWTRIADGCSLNRRTDEFLRQSGFSDLTLGEVGVFRYGTAKKSNP
jgi:ubiquinone/menaquinone biosynthesis C-methylase UbiE